MRFDPAIAAHQSFMLAVQSGELGDDLDGAREAEATFSATAGDEAKAAYRTLHAIGERRPEARSFQEFLIYITWQQVAEETLPIYFRKGLDLCNRYLKDVREATRDQIQVNQIRELRASFCRGLGLVYEEEAEEEYDRDAFKGGD